MTSPNVDQSPAVADGATAPPRRSRFRRALPPALSRPLVVGVVGVMLYVSATLTGITGFIMMIISGATSGSAGNWLFVIGVLYLVVAMLEVVVARGVLDGEPWARLVAILLSLLALAALVLRLPDASGGALVLAAVGLLYYVIAIGGLLAPASGAYFRS